MGGDKPVLNAQNGFLTADYFVHLLPELRQRDSLPLMTAVELRLDGGSVEAVGDDDLDRPDDLAWCRARGGDWLERGETLALAVPSVVVPREQNVILLEEALHG